MRALTSSRRPHVPYRDSKLTQILQPSLAGDARVAVIATMNPSPSAIEETKSTLKFAQRVKKVVLRAVVNEVVDDKALITKYRSHVRSLFSRCWEKGLMRAADCGAGGAVGAGDGAAESSVDAEPVQRRRGWTQGSFLLSFVGWRRVLMARAGAEAVGADQGSQLAARRAQVALLDERQHRGSSTQRTLFLSPPPLDLR